MAESFLSSLNREVVDDEGFTTEADAWAAVFRWLVWYNERRLHGALGCRSPSRMRKRSPHRYDKQPERPAGWGMFIEPWSACRAGP